VLIDSAVNVQASPCGNNSNEDRSSGRKSSVLSFREHWKMSSEISPSTIGIRPKQGTLKDAVWMEHAHETLLVTALTTMLDTLEAPGEELGDYAPTVYAWEGDLECSFELDTISNPEDPIDSDLELDSRFLALASICLPDTSAQSTKT
ncbi:hypothetical protein AMECASPLE_033503, partial [Ameca splendens]